MKILADALKSCLVLCSSGILLLLLTPAIVYRWTIKSLAKTFRPDLGKILDPISTSFANAPDRLGYNVMLSARIRGNLDFKRMTELINERIVCRKLVGEDHLLMPELQQYVTTWMGYYFFKQEENFNLEDHVIKYTDHEIPNQGSNNILTEDEIFKIEQTVLSKPFPLDKSYWKFYFVEGAEDSNGPFFLILFVVNHVLADGVSLFNNLIGRLWDPENLVPGSATAFRPLTQIKANPMPWSEMLLLPFKSALEFWPHVMQDCRDHIWYIEPHMRSSARLFAKSDLISISTIKDLGVFFKTSFTGAVLAGITGGIRNYLKERNRVIPSVLSCMVPLPQHNLHSDGLSNDYAYLNFDFPVGEEDDQTRFKICEEMFQVAKKSTLITSGTLFLSLLSNLGTRMPRFDTCGLDLSNLPGPTSPVFLDGQEAIEVSPSIFQGRNVETVSIMLTSYNRKYRVALSCDQNFAKSAEEAEKLLSCVTKCLTLGAYKCQKLPN